MLLPSLLKSGDQVYQKVIKQLYQKMLLLNLLITCIAFLPAKTEALIRIVNISGSVPSPLIHSIQHECNEVTRKEKIIRQWIVREDVVFLFTNLAAYKR